MSLKVLLVEDQAIIRMDLEETIIQMGHEVVGMTAFGEEAVQLFEQLKPEIIVMDIGLAGEMDGIEAATIISKKASCTIIFLTGNDDQDSLIRASRNVKPLAYLIKPFNREELSRTFALAAANSDDIKRSNRGFSQTQ